MKFKPLEENKDEKLIYRILDNLFLIICYIFDIIEFILEKCGIKRREKENDYLVYNEIAFKREKQKWWK